MNELLASLGLEGLKPVLSALLLPPVPFFVLLLLGAELLRRKRWIGWFLVIVTTLALWAECTTAVGWAMTQGLLKPPPALTITQLAELNKAQKTAIVVLGGGREVLAPEYGMSNLAPYSMERLRYGLWLAKETSLPVAFSGGIGHGSQNGPTEAEIAARIAEREFGRRLQWTESESRDTNENAIRTVTLLQRAGIERIVLVTHGFHMRRAEAAFVRAADRQNARMSIVPAPMGLAPRGQGTITGWLPTAEGFALTRLALHEWIGRLMGA